MSISTSAKERFSQASANEALRLKPAPSDLEIRAILDKHKCCPMIPDGAINVRPVSFMVGKRRVFQLTWREVGQFEDDPLSGGKSEVGLVRLSIGRNYAEHLASLGLPIVHFGDQVEATRYLVKDQRTGLE